MFISYVNCHKLRTFVPKLAAGTARALLHTPLSMGPAGLYQRAMRLDADWKTGEQTDLDGLGSSAATCGLGSEKLFEARIITESPEESLSACGAVSSEGSITNSTSQLEDIGHGLEAKRTHCAVEDRAMMEMVIALAMAVAMAMVIPS